MSQYRAFSIRQFFHLKRTMSATSGEHLLDLVRKGYMDGENYERYRQDYVPKVVDDVINMLLGNSANSAGGECDILELGAGTGKLTRKLVERLPKDMKFIASEPMQDFIRTLQKHSPNVDARQFSAESIPLPDNSVQGVVAAQCFHWFANQRAADEITRVLKPGGNLVLLWNARDLRVSWMNIMVNRMNQHLNPNEPQYAKLEWKSFLDNYKALTLKSRNFMEYPAEEFTKEGIINYFTTVSIVARLSEDDKKKTLADMKQILDTDPATKDSDNITFPIYTDVCHYVKS